MDAINSGNESDDEPMYVEMLEDIFDGSKSHTSVNRREEWYKICDHIKQSQMEYKGALLYMKNMGKGLHEVFKAVVNKIFKFTNFGWNWLRSFLFYSRAQKIFWSDQIVR